MTIPETALNLKEEFTTSIPELQLNGIRLSVEHSGVDKSNDNRPACLCRWIGTVQRVFEPEYYLDNMKPSSKDHNHDQDYKSIDLFSRDKCYKYRGGLVDNKEYHNDDDLQLIFNDCFGTNVLLFS